MMRTAGKLWEDDQGLSAAQYAMLLCLVGLVALAAWLGMADTIASLVAEASDALVSAGD